MFIEQLSYKQVTSSWELEPVEFERMTLLVGASGVGKTQILQAIAALRRISRGHSPSGTGWEIKFRDSSGTGYEWKGQFEGKSDQGLELPIPWVEFQDVPEEDKPKIEREFLSVDGKPIVKRSDDEIIFQGKPTVKLSKTESVLSLLKQEEIISGAHSAFGKIIFDDNTQSSNRLELWPFDEEEEERLEKYSELSQLRDSNERLRFKLFCLYEKHKELFDGLVEAFSDVFPFVEDVRMEPLGSSSSKKTHIRWLRQTPVLKIKEHGVADWIPEFQVSSGMKRAFVHMAELFLCSDSTLILIDEFENSLGINCIDEITASIMSSERDAQFILTSHHPYIINRIDPKFWKLVTRKGSKVTTHSMRKFKLSKSKQEAFLKLINLKEYESGVSK